MHGQVSTTMLDDHTAVVRVAGPSDRATLDALAREVRRLVRRHRHAVVKLDGLAIVDVRAVHSLLTTLMALGPGAVAFACRRLSCRRLIRHLAGDGVSIYARVTDGLAEPFSAAVTTPHAS